MRRIGEDYAMINKYMIALPDVHPGTIIELRKVDRVFGECDRTFENRFRYELDFNRWLKIRTRLIGGGFLQVLDVEDEHYTDRPILPVYDFREDVELYYQCEFEQRFHEYCLVVIPVGARLRKISDALSMSMCELKKSMLKDDRIEIINPQTIAAFGDGERYMDTNPKARKVGDNMYYIPANRKDGLRW